MSSLRTTGVAWSLASNWTSICALTPHTRVMSLTETLKPIVIVVDDEPTVRRALQMHLELLGFRVLVFESAESVLADGLPAGDACLLLDMYMPGMSGLELRRTLAESGRDLPTILMSGLDDQRTRRMMRESKPDAVLFKPFDEKTLLVAIRKALGARVKARAQARGAR